MRAGARVAAFKDKPREKAEKRRERERDRERDRANRPPTPERRRSTSEAARKTGATRKSLFAFHKPPVGLDDSDEDESESSHSKPKGPKSRKSMRHLPAAEISSQEQASAGMIFDRKKSM